jgi:hypothetical protein
MALAQCGLFLILALGWGPVAVEAHPGMSGDIDAPLAVDAPPIDPAPAATADAAPARAAAAATSSAWAWLILLSLSRITAAARRPRARGLALPLAVLLGIFACETAMHSAHHLTNPHQAERCPVYSASQHVTGLSAAPATPDLPPLSLSLDRPLVRTVPLRSQVLDGPQSRAPPALSA